MPLIGRDEDIALAQRFDDRAASGGGTLMLSGETGVGKTVLLEVAAGYAEARGVRFLRATVKLRDGGPDGHASDDCAGDENGYGPGSGLPFRSFTR